MAEHVLVFFWKVNGTKKFEKLIKAVYSCFQKEKVNKKINNDLGKK